MTRRSAPEGAADRGQKTAPRPARQSMTLTRQQRADISARLKALRQTGAGLAPGTQRWTQNRLAKKLDVDTRTIGLIFNGGGSLTEQRLLDLWAIFKQDESAAGLAEVKQQCDLLDRPDLYQRFVEATSALPQLRPSSPPPGLSSSQEALWHQLVEGHHSAAHADPAFLRSVCREGYSGVPGYLLHRYATLASRNDGLLYRQYVNLRLLVQRDGDLERRVAPFESLADMLNAYPDEEGWVVLGAPGGGKSTLLQHHEMAQIGHSLRQLHEYGTTSPTEAFLPAVRPELCMYERLADYGEDSPDPETWLKARWAQRHPELPSLDELRRHFRLRFLFDGLNEVNVSEGAYHETVRCFADWARLMAARQCAPVFTVRTRDYSVMLDTRHGLKFQAAHVDAWTPQQIQAYCLLRLGPLLGGEVWNMLSSDHHAGMLRLCGNPFNLKAQCDLYTQLRRPVHRRSELMGGIAWLRLKQELVPETEHTLCHPALLDATDRQQIRDDGYWRAQLTLLPSHGILIPSLERQALFMLDGTQASHERTQLASVANWINQADVRQAWLKAVEALNLVTVDEARDLLEFTHPLWKEFFAASALAFRPDIVDGRVDLGPPPLPPLPPNEDSSQQLPMARTSRWQVPVTLAVEMADQARAETLLAHTTNAGGVAMAGHAAAARRDTRDEIDLPATLQADIRRQLLEQSLSAPDVRRRIEAAESLGALGDDIRYERVGVSCLPRPTQWMPISENRRDASADASTRLAVRMAFAPVTNHEFRCFVDNGGYNDDRWWTAPSARAWRDGSGNTADMFEFWRPRLAYLREHPEEPIGPLFPFLTSHYLRRISVAARWSEAEAEDWMQREFGGGKTEPAHWRNVSFNKPLQPVIGVCLFEARAYCLWLSAITGRLFRLPTEDEWMCAAAGGGSRTWPWLADQPPHRFQMNAQPASLQRTTPVGVFPEGNSPEGISDLAGNIWEWTDSLYREKAHPVVNTTEEHAPTWTVAGGAWDYPTHLCQPSCFSGSLPFGRDNLLGFRMVEDV